MLRISDRTPLRIKLIALLSALVAIALAVIGFVTVIVFSGYLQNQADTQLKSLESQVRAYATEPRFPGFHRGLVVSPTSVVEFIPASGGQPIQVAQNQTGPTLPLPAIPTSKAWLTANSGHPVTVPAVTGNYDWRVVVHPAAVTISDSFTEQVVSGTLVVGVNLLNIHQTIGYLIKLDVLVSVVILLVLVVVGIAVVQANLRPLVDIELTAGQIARGHLDHRVPERDPRTEIGSLGKSLNTMLSQIETAFNAQQESEQAAHESEERMRRFIADASHELRTPLTTIRGFAEYYRQRGGLRKEQHPSSRTDGGSSLTANGHSPKGLPPEDLDRIMSRLEAEASRMGLLVEDLLQLARLDQQRPLDLAPVDLLTLAADAVQDARLVAPGRPIDLIVAPGAAFIVDGDEPRLRQVIGNLVNNALTHTPPGTPVRVKIGSGTLGPVPGGGAVPAAVLDVEDDGPGMSAEQARRVFERFYRADQARNRASGGTGLGLAIVAGLVAAHGGTVALRTAPGEGADFQVKLPLSPDARVVAQDLSSDPDSEELDVS
jgi:two-component system OmpR family sensor kinase